MEIFEEYSPYSDKDAQLALAGDMKDQSWFKINVFTKKKINLEKDLEILNDLLSKHESSNYEEFSVCFENLLLPDRAFGFISRRTR